MSQTKEPIFLTSHFLFRDETGLSRIFSGQDALLEVSKRDLFGRPPHIGCFFALAAEENTEPSGKKAAALEYFVYSLRDSTVGPYEQGAEVMTEIHSRAKFFAKAFSLRFLPKTRRPAYIPHRANAIIFSDNPNGVS